MQTDFPTVEIHFGFALTFCRVKVYAPQETFIRKVLEAHKVEFLSAEEHKRFSWQEIDTRILTDLIYAALPWLLEEAGLTGALAQTFLESVHIKPNL